MNILSGVFTRNLPVDKKPTAVKTDERKELVESTKTLSLTPEMIMSKPFAEKISFESIAGVIMRVRTNEFIGKGKLTKDEYLADSLFSLVRHYEPDTRLTYELVEKAISFVKRNPIMGAGKWTKEEHLAEYIYATIRLSNSSGNNSSATTSSTNSDPSSAGGTDSSA